jgi:hypothetical protein
MVAQTQTATEVNQQKSESLLCIMRLEKAKGFDWETSQTLAVLTGVDVIYAVQRKDSRAWAIVQANFGVANNPENNVKVLHNEDFHEFPEFAGI